MSLLTDADPIGRVSILIEGLQQAQNVEDLWIGRLTGIGYIKRGDDALRCCLRQGDVTDCKDNHIACAVTKFARDVGASGVSHVAVGIDTAVSQTADRAVDEFTEVVVVVARQIDTTGREKCCRRTCDGGSKEPCVYRLIHTDTRIVEHKAGALWRVGVCEVTASVGTRLTGLNLRSANDPSA